MIIAKESHLDHGLTVEHIAWILRTFGDVEEFKLITVDIPEELPSVKCALWGPAVGDAPVHERSVHYQARGDRKGESRLVWNTHRQSRKLTVIMGPHEGRCILYTTYGGPAAPREPWDPSLDDAGLAESKAFWAQHALAH